MTKQQTFLAIVLSLIGLAVWIVISKTSNTVEAWDSINYYLIGLPIMFLASGIAGYIQPDRLTIWGISIVILQPIALLVQTRGSPLVVVGLFFFLVFTVIAIGCAYIGKMVRSNHK